MNDNAVRIELINTLFATFPREYGVSDADYAKRKAVYVAMLRDLPVEAIKLACRKMYLEQDKLPSIASLVKSVRSLMGSVNEDTRIKGWSEAWKEIVKQMYACPYGQNPKWSSPEIKEAVDTYGWQRLQTVNAGTDFAVAESQIRRYYEQICSRSSENEINAYILSKINGVQALSRASRSLQESTKRSEDISIPLLHLEDSGGAQNA